MTALDELKLARDTLAANLDTATAGPHRPKEIANWPDAELVVSAVSLMPAVMVILDDAIRVHTETPDAHRGWTADALRLARAINSPSLPNDRKDES